MIDYRPVFYVIGILLTVLAAGMGVPLLVELLNGNPNWRVFAATGGFTVFMGVTLLLTMRAPLAQLSIRQAFDNKLARAYRVRRAALRLQRPRTQLHRRVL